MRMLSRLTGPIVAAFLVPAISLAADHGDLKSAHEQLVKALNSGDGSAAVQLFDDGAVGFFQNNALAWDLSQIGKLQFQEAIAGFFDNTESFKMGAANTQFRVNGDVGLVWGIGEMTMKPIDGQQVILHYRATWTFVKSAGEWVVASWHVSRIPPSS